MRGPVPLALVCSCLALLAPAGAVAQRATPAAGPVVPDPSECRVEPRPAALLRGTPAATGPVLVDLLRATPVPAADLPAGRPAAGDAAAGIEVTVREAIACVNAGDRDRLFALFSDDFPPAGLYTLGVYDLYAFDPPVSPLPADDRVALPPIAEARILADGRVGAFLGESTADPAVFLFFVRSDDGNRWLIDAVVAVGDATATP